MNLTKKQAIYEHRKMWNWIADETLKRKEKVTKEDYFLEHMGKYPIWLNNKCWCCEYAVHNGGTCVKCPIVWDGADISCTFIGSSFFNWDNETDYVKAAEYARKIAELPERE